MGIGHQATGGTLLGGVNLDEFVKRIQPDFPTCPDITIRQAVRNSIIEFCEESWILQKHMHYSVNSQYINTANGNSFDIHLGNHTDLRPLAVTHLNINGTDYAVDYYDKLKSTVYLNTLYPGVKLFTIIDNHTIRIFDLPIDSSDIAITIIFKPTQQATSVEQRLFEDFVEDISSGARSTLLNLPGKPWHNSILSAHHRTIFKAGISKAKAQVRKGYTRRTKYIQSKEFGV